MKTTHLLRLLLALALLVLLPSCAVVGNATIDDCVIAVAELVTGPFVLARDGHHYRSRVKPTVRLQRSTWKGLHP